MRWQVLATEPSNTLWLVLFKGTRVGDIQWVNELDAPMTARTVIEQGMNGDFGTEQPPRCWTFGPEGSPGRWTMLHNGSLMGEVRWDHRPPTDPKVWQARILAGLNYTGNGTITPPAPAHLRARCA